MLTVSMKDLDVLALDFADHRGHKMSGLIVNEYNENYAHRYCLTCGRRVDLNTRPMPNECSIMGEAVAVNCD